MSGKLSAGILVYRRSAAGIEVLLAHPGGPYWAKKDTGAWSIPKGEVEEGEKLDEAAKREFAEELGQSAPDGEYIELGSFKRKDGKQVFAWAVEGDLDVTHIVSNTLLIDWPPKSSKQLEIPEIDKAAWIPLAEAALKMHTGQDVFLERLASAVHIDLPKPPEQQTLL